MIFLGLAIREKIEELKDKVIKLITLIAGAISSMLLFYILILISFFYIGCQSPEELRDVPEPMIMPLPDHFKADDLPPAIEVDRPAKPTKKKRRK